MSLSQNKDRTPGHFGLTQDDLPPMDSGPIDLRSWFGQERAALPIELEIGSGKGTFLLQQSQQTPNVNYIGIEYARAFWLYAADRMRRHNAVAVRMVYCEAALFVRCYVAAGLFQQVHVYFPDPWPKARHHKRRLIQVPFLHEAHRILAPGGNLRLATDHADYFQWMNEHADKVPELFEKQPFESPVSAGEGELVGTNFERKYRLEGRPFYSMVLRKREVTTTG